MPYSTCGNENSPEWTADRVWPLLAALASEPPSFRLPSATASHTRAYLDQNTGDPAKRALIFDGFVALDRAGAEGSVVAVWPRTKLSAEQRHDLGDLLGAMNYLGRSESWVLATLCAQPETTSCNCVPTPGEGMRGDVVPVACAISETEFRGADWLDALAFSTSDLLKKKLSGPPAMRYVDYVRPANCFLPDHPNRTLPLRVVEAVLFALDGKVLPPATAAMEIAEQVRTRLMGAHKWVMGDETAVSSRFSGKGPDGGCRRDHGHVYILPWDDDCDGRLDHFVVFTRQQFDSTETVAIDRVTELWQPDGRPSIRCVPVQWGTRSEVLKTATRVRSVTPFVPTRHWRKGRGTVSQWLQEEVARECGYHGLPVPVRVSVVPRLDLLGGRSYRWLDFRRNRKGDDPKLGFGFELKFEEQVQTPFSIGYGSHFGLGQFRPVDSARG